MFGRYRILTIPLIWLLQSKCLNISPDPEVGLTEAVRVLKPRDYAITALPVKLPILMHLYDFESPDEVLALYKKVGLQVVDFETKEFQRQMEPFTDTFTLSIKS